MVDVILSASVHAGHADPGLRSSTWSDNYHPRACAIAGNTLYSLFFDCWPKNLRVGSSLLRTPRSTWSTWSTWSTPRSTCRTELHPSSPSRGNPCLLLTERLLHPETQGFIFFVASLFVVRFPNCLSGLGNLTLFATCLLFPLP